MQNKGKFNRQALTWLVLEEKVDIWITLMGHYNKSVSFSYLVSPNFPFYHQYWHIRQFVKFQCAWRLGALMQHIPSLDCGLSLACVGPRAAMFVLYVLSLLLSHVWIKNVAGSELRLCRGSCTCVVKFEFAFFTFRWRQQRRKKTHNKERHMNVVRSLSTKCASQ